MEAVYITLIIVVGIILVVFLLRDRLSQLFIRASSQGEAELKMTASQKTTQERSTENPYTLDISGNSLFGKNKVTVERDRARITGNTAVGVNEINASLPTQAAATSSQTTSEQTSNPQPQAYLTEASGQPLEAELITETNQEQ
jgi:hypothetical protein